MTRPALPPRSAPDRGALAGADRIGVIGDIHGDMRSLLGVLQALSERHVQVLLTLGDAGVFCPGSDPGYTLDRVAARLKTNGQVLYAIDGDNDDYGVLAGFPVEPDGTRRLRENITHLSRGHRTTLVSGKSFGALGGARSIDFRYRTAGEDWWASEAITDDDLLALGPEPLDVLIGHDAPLDLPPLEHYFDLPRLARFSEAAVAYAKQGRVTFHRGFLNVRPSLYLGAHWHQPVDEVVGYFDGTRGFASRVILLDQLQSRTTASCAILDTHTLAVELLTRLGKPAPEREPQVTRLTGQSGGRWMVQTLGAQQHFDLDEGTWERLPGPYSSPNMYPGVQRLRTLDQLEIGKVGKWTLPGDYLTDYFWAQSSIVKHIKRLP